MKFSIRLNNDMTLHQFVELARHAEAAGFDQIWVSNDLFWRSAPVLVAAVAAATSVIRLGIGIMNPYTVHPVELAMIAATLQEASDGRFLLGLGAGAPEFLGWASIERGSPLATTREALRDIRALQAGHTAGWSEQAYLRAPAIPAPIYLGAMSPKMLELAGAEADGAIALLFPPEHYTVAATHIADGCKATDRTLADVDLVAGVWLSLDEDRMRADHALAAKIAYYGPSFSPYLLSRAGLAREDFAGIEAAMRRRDEAAAAALVTTEMLHLGISGGVDDVIARCRALIATGVTHLSFGPPLGPVPIDAVDLLGAAILPTLRALHNKEGS